MNRVLIADALSPRAVEVFAENGIAADVRTGLKGQALLDAIADYDGLAVRSATKVTAEVLAAAPRLRVVGRAGIGVDNIDVPAATQRGVCVMNTPFGNAITTAEHAIALMFSLARQIPLADRTTRSGKWEKSRFMGQELAGKVLGIVGCGNIGSIVADRAQGLKMRVIAYDPYLSAERASGLGVEAVTLEDLLRRADIVTLHVPLTEQTRNVIDANALATMKKGALLINCARGELVVEADLEAALRSGHLAGAALDVFAVEPPGESPLFALDQVVVTPHLGAATTEAQEKVAVQIAEQMSAYLKTGAVENALNMPAVTAEEAPKLRPYMKLVEQLGSFAGQLTQGGIKAVTIEYEGHAASLNTRPLSALALQGLLAPQMESVNMVNAPVIAKERDIAVSEIKHDRPTDYQTLVRVCVSTDEWTRSVSGTLFGGDKPRVVEIKGIPVEAELSPHMLYITNRDVPGMIGALGAVLGNAGVNIATFHLGRASRGGDAIALVVVDERVQEEVIAAVRAIPGILQVTALHF